MENSRLNAVCQRIEEAFQEVAAEVSGIEFKKSSFEELLEDTKVAVVIGIVGDEEGRILVETGYSIAQQLTEGMNGAPLENTMDLYLFMGELVNTFCGRAITFMNNEYQDRKFRLTPPAIFTGLDLKMNTPNVQSKSIFFTGKYGTVRIDIGFGGVEKDGEKRDRG